MEEVNKKIDKLDNHMEAIKHLLITLNDKVESLESKVEDLNDKVDEEVLEDNFVENVYDNVKHPLGYICKKIKGLTGTSGDQYTLTDLEDKDEVD